MPTTASKSFSPRHTPSRGTRRMQMLDLKNSRGLKPNDGRQGKAKVKRWVMRSWRSTDRRGDDDQGRLRLYFGGIDQVAITRLDEERDFHPAGTWPSRDGSASIAADDRLFVVREGGIHCLQGRRPDGDLHACQDDGPSCPGGQSRTEQFSSRQGERATACHRVSNGQLIRSAASKASTSGRRRARCEEDPGVSRTVDQVGLYGTRIAIVPGDAPTLPFLWWYGVRVIWSCCLLAKAYGRALRSAAAHHHIEAPEA